jgi:hypothetical protein
MNVLCVSFVVFVAEREMERARIAAEMAERNKPLKEKFSDLVVIAKEVRKCI